MCIAFAADGFVEFLNVRRAELMRVSFADERDEEFTGLEDWLMDVAPLDFCENDGRDSGLLAEVFGWASSFCSASKVSAARLDVKDLRLRLPERSRQSA